MGKDIIPQAWEHSTFLSFVQDSKLNPTFYYIFYYKCPFITLSSLHMRSQEWLKITHLTGPAQISYQNVGPTKSCLRSPETDDEDCMAFFCACGLR